MGSAGSQIYCENHILLSSLNRGVSWSRQDGVARVKGLGEKGTDEIGWDMNEWIVCVGGGEGRVGRMGVQVSVELGMEGMM